MQTIFLASFSLSETDAVYGVDLAFPSVSAHASLDGAKTAAKRELERIWEDSELGPLTWLDWGQSSEYRAIPNTPNWFMATALDENGDEIGWAVVQTTQLRP